MQLGRIIALVVAVLLVGAAMVYVQLNNTEAGSDAATAGVTTASSSFDTGSANLVEAGFAPEVEPVLSAKVDFSQNAKYELDACDLIVQNGKMDVVVAGKNVGSFKLNSNGQMVPAGAAPDGNQIKTSALGSHGDTSAGYRVYPADYEVGNGVTPIIGVDHSGSGGMISVTPGSDITRKHKESRGKTKNYGTGGSCSIGGGGGG